jgi:hypothetical protein
MAVSTTLSVTPAAPAHGATVTAVYTVHGNDGTADQAGTVAGSATVGGILYNVSTTMTLPGAPPLPVTYSAPTCPGLTFTATSDPATFTAVVP